MVNLRKSAALLAAAASVAGLLGPMVAPGIAKAETLKAVMNSDLKIVGFADIREIAFRPGHYAAIPRRYCAGTAFISDGTRHKIFYSIGEDTGLLGVSWGIEWCVVGLDRNWAYNPRCKMAQP